MVVALPRSSEPSLVSSLSRFHDRFSLRIAINLFVMKLTLCGSVKGLIDLPEDNEELEDKDTDTISSSESFEI